MKSLKLFFTLSALLMTPACGTYTEIDHTPSTGPGRSYSVVPELAEKTREFFSACDGAGVKCSVYHLNIRIGDPGSGRAGACNITWHGTGRMEQEIVIDRKYVDNVGVLWHELLHCVRFQEHTEGNVPHIMRRYAMNKEEWNKRPENEWLRESLDRDVRFNGYENK